MTREKMCELAVILANLENTIKEMTEQKEWLSVPEMAACLGMSPSAVSTFKDRPAFQPYLKNANSGIKIKNCTDAIKLMRCYKYRNFEFEQQLLAKKAAE